jgi:hypothetical protein
MEVAINIQVFRQEANLFVTILHDFLQIKCEIYVPFRCAHEVDCIPYLPRGSSIQHGNHRDSINVIFATCVQICSVY